MRLLNRNKRTFWYANYKGTEDILNDEGEYSGQQRVLYTEPVQTTGYISASSGDAFTAQFGTDIAYDRTILLESTDMSENSILWIDIEPKQNDNDISHNYIVTSVAKSLNHVAVAIKQVEVSNYATNN